MNNATDKPFTTAVSMTFPIGYHNLHPDVSMNFQMNRWYGWVGEPEMLEDMRMAALRIATYADWKREFMAHFYQQIKTLKNERSITVRLFTRSDSARNHCQVGNDGLTLRMIVNWLDGMLLRRTGGVIDVPGVGPGATPTSAASPAMPTMVALWE